MNGKLMKIKQANEEFMQFEYKQPFSTHMGDYFMMKEERLNSQSPQRFEKEEEYKPNFESFLSSRRESNAIEEPIIKVEDHNSGVI